MVQRRRRPVEEDYYEDDGPTLVEVVLQSFVEPVVKSAVDQLKHGVQRAVRWTAQRMIAGGVVTGMLIAGLILVLIAGVKGLEALGCPLWLSYLSMGIVAVIAALVLLKSILSTPPDDLDE
jgi:TRAP-type C4-dicarboxylate transport system permease small subunit